MDRPSGEPRENSVSGSGSAASTATMTKRGSAINGPLRLEPGQVLCDAISAREYRIERYLARGGFGAAYLAVRVDERKRARSCCVLKVTTEASAWHREAYFGHLLRTVPGLVEVYDSFAWAPEGAPGSAIYCLVSEYVEEGDLSSYFARYPEPWPETHARREILRLLKAITTMHQSGAVHRDITPGNVFVAAKRVLKLGDFGIALHRVGNKDVPADAFAPRFAPAAILDGAKSWRQSDDVHQIGQVFAALLTGIASRKITAAEVKRLECSPHTKSVLQRCIGERRKCFESAAEMLRALEARRPGAEKKARVTTLQGKRVVFTGELSIARAQAKNLARKAGAVVEDRVSQSTDIVIVGDQSPHWKAEAKGQKLLDVDCERERGHIIATLGESRFLTLAGYQGSGLPK